MEKKYEVSFTVIVNVITNNPSEVNELAFEFLNTGDYDYAEMVSTNEVEL
jgi:hypothetical protein